MAIACLRLFTVPPFPPFPDFNVPRFLRCMALFTLLPAAFPYFGMLYSPIRKQLSIASWPTLALTSLQEPHSGVL